MYSSYITASLNGESYDLKGGGQKEVNTAGAVYRFTLIEINSELKKGSFHVKRVN